MFSKKIGLFGATCLVGEKLIPLLHDDFTQIHAFSRKPQTSEGNGLAWHQFSMMDYSNHILIENWLCAAPVWVLPNHFKLFESCGIRRIVVLSSTSLFTKAKSPDEAEKATAARLSEGEERLKKWATSKGVEWVILRPTLIYGYGRDKNIAEITRFIRRFGFFPLLGKAKGLRQPVHVDDVAKACVAALESPTTTNRAYNISGDETLPYREMVSRVFAALHRRPQFLPIPLFIFSFAVACIRLLPRYKHWSAAMAERMNTNLVFDNSDAERDFGFSSRPFQITPEDLPR